MSLFEQYKIKVAKQGRISGLEFEITDACNLNCNHCYKIRKNNFIDYNLVVKALKEAEQLGVIKIGFNGGEPLLHPQFVNLAQATLQRGFVLSVLTNATLITRSILDQLNQWSAINFQISLYGHNDESSEKITGNPHSFQDVISSIKLLSEYNFRTTVTLLARKDEIDYIPDLIGQIERLNAEVILMLSISPRENGDTEPIKFRSSDLELMKILPYESFEDISHQQKISFLNNEKINKPEEACGAGLNALAITTKGEIVPCLLLKNFSLGNFLKISLKSALKSQKLADFKQLNRLPNRCTSCELSDYCSRCPAMDMFETGNLAIVSKENCRIAALRKKIFDL